MWLNDDKNFKLLEVLLEKVLDFSDEDIANPFAGDSEENYVTSESNAEGADDNEHPTKKPIPRPKLKYQE